MFALVLIYEPKERWSIMKLVVCAVLMLCLLPALMIGQTKPAQDVWERVKHIN
jgi:hypothetical protein